MHHATTDLDQPGLRKFGLSTGFILVVLFGLLLPWLLEHAYPLWPWIVAAILGTLGLARPDALAPIYRAWMKFGHVLGWINTRIILGVMFYVIVLPIGLLMRASGKDPMARKMDATAKSYRVCSENRSRNHLEKPF